MDFDDDDFNLDYVPTIANSRSGSMKKISKKPDNKKKQTKTKPAQDFDLLEELLSPQKEKPKSSSYKNEKSISKNQPLHKNDTDAFFDEPSTSVPVSKINIKPAQQKKEKFSSLQNSGSLIIDEEPVAQNKMFKFKKPGTVQKRPETADTSFKKPEEQDAVFNPASRRMKPPIRKKQSKGEKSYNLDLSDGIGLSLPDESSNVTSKKEDKMIEKVPELKKRSSSGELKLNNLELKIDEKKEDKKEERKVGFGVEKKETYKSSLNLENSFTVKNEDYDYGRGYEKKNDYQMDKYDEKKNEKKGYEDAEKQINFMKRNYERHVETLQKNLDEQIKVNKESRQRIMKEANSMLDNERKRMQKMHEEEMSRVKEMMTWQKNKIEENYKNQINSLKSQVEMLKPNSQTGTNVYNSLEIDKKQVQYLEEKLRVQKKLLEDREKILEKRELDMEQYERELGQRRRHEDERLREEEKRVLKKEAQYKKGMIEERRNLQQEKQSMAVEVTTLELEHHRKTEKLQSLIKQLEMEKQQLQKEKESSRTLTSQIIENYKSKHSQLEEEKKKLTQLEAQLVNKIRIVEAMKTNGETVENHKENSWMEDKIGKKRAISTQKVEMQKKMESTQSRFLNISQNVKENLRSSGNGKFDIDRYMMSMSKYTRNREGWV